MMTALHVYNSGSEKLLFTTQVCFRRTSYSQRQHADWLHVKHIYTETALTEMT